MTQKQNQVIPIVVCEKLIRAQEKAFNEIAVVHNEVVFKKEIFFATEILRKSDFMLKIAMNKPESLRAAVLNIATVGLSLNPALKVAHLIPRKGEIVMDIPYRGLVQLATDTGSVQWVQAEIVYEKDNYINNGVGEKPTHEKDPFLKDRGKMTGAFCVAKTHEGDYLVTEMPIDEINNIKKRCSESFKKGNQSPWLSDEKEMIKKTVVKRAEKMWPKSDKTGRLQEAIKVVNEHEGIDFEKMRDTTPPSENRKMVLVDALIDIEDGKKRLIKHCQIKYQRDIEGLDDLNANETEYAINFLKGYGDKNA